ncbi:uncharacterized protein LOC105687828 [Athalia rosae]|uniref:uncharacterized protein LOC105687828 n=1 Tax=Athalia rosae TaxID=37344 RepID=UPI000626B7D0|nr:uncharacterized protein LOC105687828 [Athalia rosae]XP_020709044.1 uncharacterized protein LOC105687828 [Athalia rosae]
MLKHILTGQPATATSRQQQHHHHHQQQQQHHTNEFSNASSSGSTLHHLQTSLNNSTANGNAVHHHQLHHQDLQHQIQQYNSNSSTHLHHHNQHRNNALSTIRGGSADAYDSIGGNSSTHISRAGGLISQHPATNTPSSSHHPLNHSQLSVNNLSQQRLQNHSLLHSHPLNLSTLSTSKHSVDSASPVGGIGLVNNVSSLHHHHHNHGLPHSSSVERETHGDRSKVNGGLDITRISRLPSHATPSPAPVLNSGNVGRIQTGSSIAGPSIVPLNTSLTSSLSHHQFQSSRHQQEAAGVKEMLTSLGLLCLVSLLLALLSLIFLLKISPLNDTPCSSLICPEEYAIVYEVTLALCALALSLNLCCLLVCAIQFLFAVELVKSSYQGHRTNIYLQQSSISRVCAVGGFFISIPVFLTGMILYTFIQFQLTPAIVMSVFIGLGIIFCGCAMVHNVFVWQREKTNAVKALAREQCEAAAALQRQKIQQQQQQQHRDQNSQPQSQHQQHHQRGSALQSTLQNSNSTARMGQKSNALSPNHSTATLSLPHSKGQVYHPNNHNHHHVSMSMSIPQTNSSQHNHSHQIGSHRSNVATPPTPGGDLSPPSPTHKHNRSHTLAREISGSISPGLPTATLDLSSAATTNSPHELSTLV